MKQSKRILIGLGILAVLVVIFFIVTNSISTYNGLSVSDGSGDTKLQICLKNQDIKLYINSADTDSALVNTGLTDYLQYFKIQNCFLNNTPCIDNQISSFPTWVINGKTYSGDITEAEFLQYIGCSA